MKSIFFYLIAFLVILLNHSAKAQMGLQVFKPQLSLNVASGLSIMNSDNHTQGYQNLGIMQGNGSGLHLELGPHYQFSPQFGVQGNLEYNRFNGFEDQGERVNTKSFSFQSDVLAATASLVVNLASSKTLRTFYKPVSHKRYSSSVIVNWIHFANEHFIKVPYIKAGAGVLFANSISWQGNKPSADVKFPIFTYVIPVGAGIKFRISNQVHLAPEVTCNFPLSDRLDNRAVTGSLGHNDIFVTGALKINFTPATAKKK